LLGLSRRWRDYQGLSEDAGVIDKLKELARRYPRFGYRRLHQMLRRQYAEEGWAPAVNVNRVRRLCKVAGLCLPRRQRRKRRGQGVKTSVIAEYPNYVWAYDFVFDWCENGRQLKFLTVVDEYTREGLAIEVDHRMAARQVWQVLQRVMAQRGVPAFVRSDNGPEFVAKYLTRMLAARGVACQHIEPGSPWQNGKNERFNGIFRDECANMETFHHRDHARALAKLFLRYYNQERPHWALDYQTPVEFARRHPPLGAGHVVSDSKVPSPAPNGGCRNVPAGASLPEGVIQSV
jgi:putative transposase